MGSVDAVTGPEWKRFTLGCKTAAEGGLMREVRKDIRRSAKDAGEDVRVKSPAYLPDRYAADMAPTLRITTSATGSGVLVRARAKTGTGKARELKKLEAGVLRHPNWGRWVKGKHFQSVRPGFWSEPLMARKADMGRAVKDAMDRVADRIA